MTDIHRSVYLRPSVLGAAIGVENNIQVNHNILFIMSRYERSNSRLYIGNLPDDVKERELADLFGKFGRIRDIDIKFGRTSNGTAYAFLEFDSQHDAEDAIEARDGCRFGNTRLRVEFTGERRPRRLNFRGGPPKRTSFRVVVSGLPVSASWQDLKDHMRLAGPVGYADARDGRGVVEYETEDDMRYAIRKLDKSEFRNPFTRSSIRVRAEVESDSPNATWRRSTSSKRHRSRSSSPRRPSHKRSHVHSVDSDRTENDRHQRRRRRRSRSRSRSSSSIRSSRDRRSSLSTDHHEVLSSASSSLSSYTREKTIIQDNIEKDQHKTNDEFPNNHTYSLSPPLSPVGVNSMPSETQTTPPSSVSHTESVGCYQQQEQESVSNSLLSSSEQLNYSDKNSTYEVNDTHDATISTEKESKVVVQ